MKTTTDIVAKLWGLCNVLRDDGITYSEYVTELTYLLFLKMLEETGKEDRLPEGWRWSLLAKREGMEQLDYYKAMLLELGKTRDALVSAIFIDAQTRLRKPTNLKALTSNIDHWTGFPPVKRGWATSMKACWKRTRPTRNPAPGNISRPAL